MKLYVCIFVICLGINDTIQIFDPLTNVRHEVRRNSQPYMVSLKIQNENDYFYSHPDSTCTGALVSKNFVLTAASCIDRYASNITAILGAHSLTSIESSQQSIGVSQIIIHDKYQQSIFESQNDIALLKLARPVESNNYISPIALPSFGDVSEDYANKNVKVFTWYDNNNYRYNTLQEISEKINTNEHCKNLLSFLLKWNPNNLCGYPAQRLNCVQDCSELTPDDNGVPLVLDNGKNRVLIGIFSYPYDYTSMQDIFLSTNKYLDWIKKNSDVVIPSIRISITHPTHITSTRPTSSGTTLVTRTTETPEPSTNQRITSSEIPVTPGSTVTQTGVPSSFGNTPV